MTLPEYNDRLSQEEHSDRAASIFLPQQSDTDDVIPDDAAMPDDPAIREEDLLGAAHSCKSVNCQKNPGSTHGPHPSELANPRPGVPLSGNHVPTAERLIQMNMKV